MVALKDVMCLVDEYARMRTAFAESGSSSNGRYEEVANELIDVLEQVCADAQRYRSLQGKIDEQA